MLRTIIIDDDEIITLLQKNLVKKCDLDSDPYSFKNAEHALDFLQNDSDPSNDYLILLDINMPQMTGWEFLNRLKSVDNNDRFSVAMVTSSIDRSDKRKAANDNHVLDFIEKPVSARHCEKLKGLARLSVHFQESA